MLLLSVSCYSSPFREETTRTLAGAGKRYYALQVKFGPSLQRFFGRLGCNYNSTESWTVYFSRDPDSYRFSEGQHLPDFGVMRRISDLKLFLPRGVYLLDDYYKAGAYGMFPVITSLKIRNYRLTRKEQAFIELQQGDIRPEGLPVAEPADADAEPQIETEAEAEGPNLAALPEVVNESGLVRQKRVRKNQKPLSYPNVPKRNFRPLQRAKLGPRFLNYLLMVGADKRAGGSRMELWHLPVLLPDSNAPFQYLGELEIDLLPLAGRAESLRLNYLGQGNLVFRVRDNLPYWKPHLDEWLRGLHPEPVSRRPGGRLETKRWKTGVRSIFFTNLLQVVANEIPNRRYPYVRMYFHDRPECQF
ncbi:hypothetical protein P0082_02310 [Candidatus Haliotispira prima]|uniref:Lipoprotein n=1 Tax=Candidatus Haliotispira prima TaxID=3034016 RepID=A0ABY8MI72_9SPIO|nr:hypothetical protein P0082_02310 [Candidatus Haliotispira prima]